MQLSCQTNKKSDKYMKKIIYPSDFHYIGYDFWVLNGNRTHTLIGIKIKISNIYRCNSAEYLTEDFFHRRIAFLR